jgi:hypothetical protein
MRIAFEDGLAFDVNDLCLCSDCITEEELAATEICRVTIIAEEPDEDMNVLYYCDRCGHFIGRWF